LLELARVFLRSAANLQQSALASWALDDCKRTAKPPR